MKQRFNRKNTTFFRGRSNRPLFLRIKRSEVITILNFQQRILSRIRSSKNPLPEVEKWIAQTSSRQSATETLRWTPHYRTAREAKCIIFLGLYLQPWETWEIIDRIRNSAYFQRYSGEWKQVQDLLEQVTDFETFEENIWNSETEDSFFGNFLRECERFLKKNSYLRKEEPIKRRPKKKVYRRGYQDKGSLRPFHQRGRNLPEENPGEDRRRKVKYGSLPELDYS